MIRRLFLGAAPWVACAAVLTTVSCGEDDPLADRLTERSAYEVIVQSFNPKDDGTIFVELEVRSSIGPALEGLTVLLRQHDAAQEIVREERVTLDLSAMDATGSLVVYTSVRSAGADVEALSAVMEYDPPAAAYAEFPEIREVLP